jgi:histidinol-phosphate phosphatase family protein
MSRPGKKAAIFLDKDGTLIPDLPYNVDPERITLGPNVPQALALLARLDRPLVVVSNQSGVARGLFSEESLQGVHLRLAELFAACGAVLAGFYCCPHHPEGTVPAYTMRCVCRKPAPGLLQQAATELNLSLEHSWMVGDALTDVAAGLAAGCSSILITPTVSELLVADWHTPYHRVPDLQSAAACIALARAQDP